MKHIQRLTRVPMRAQDAGLTPLEQLILLLLGVFFGDWDNYNAISQNLQKYYSKT